jgi:tetratricopeptide (TPR) repeat protein
MLELVPRALESPGPGNHLTISIMRDLGRQYMRLNDLATATDWFQQAVLAAVEFPGDSLLRLYAELGLAEAYLRAGNVEQAQPVLDRLKPHWGSQSSSPDGQTVFIEALFAFVQGDTSTARQLLLSAKELMDKEPDDGVTYRPEVDLLTAQLSPLN